MKFWLTSLIALLWTGGLLQTSVRSQINLSGLDHYRAGHYELAAQQWQRQLEIAKKKGDRQTEGQLWMYLSLAYQKQGQWNLAQEALTTSTQLLSQQKTAQLAQTYNAQGQLALLLGDVTGALKAWKEAEAIYQQRGDSIGIQGSQVNQAIAYEQGGFYRRACLKMMSILDIANRCDFSSIESPELIQAFEQLSPSLQAIALNTLSQTLIEMGELNVAQALVDHQTSQNSSLSTELQLLHINLATAQYRSLQQEMTRSRSQRQRSLLEGKLNQEYISVVELYSKILKDVKLQNHPLSFPLQVDFLSFELQNANLDQKLNSRELEYLESILNQIPIPTEHEVRSAYMARIKFAEVLLQIAEYDSSFIFQYDSKIKNLLQPLLVSTSKGFLPQAEREAFAKGSIGHFYELKQDWQNAEVFTRQALERSPNTDYTYRWQWQLGRVLTAQGREDEAIKAYQDSLTALESVRQNLTALQRNAQLSFRDEIEPLYREFASVLLASPQPTSYRLIQARQIIDQLQVREVEDFLLQNCVSASLASLDAFIAQKTPESALIYTIIQDQGLDVILKVGSQFNFHRVDLSKAEIQKRVKAYRLILQEKLPSAKRDSQALGQELYRWLIQPFASQLNDIQTLVFVLDGELRDIPMATLHDGQQYLIEQYAIAVTPGLQVLETELTQSQHGGMLVAGASQGDLTLGLPPLPAVKREVEEIATLRPNVEVLLDETFTESSLQSALEKKTASIIHFATHGQFSSNPDNTYITTGRGERITIDKLGELLKQRTQLTELDLLFLSACQTLAGDRWASLGMAGIAIRSGARSTIASVWNADDEAAADLVTTFYKELGQGATVSKAEALRQAQIKMIYSQRHDLPVYWSPFVLIGNWQ